MDFDFSEEQNILKKSAHDFLAKNYPKDMVRELKASEKGYSPELWSKMAELGWTGIVFPEENGGSAGSFLDLIILLEEMGYNICPSPFFSTVVLGGLAILFAGNDEQKNELLTKIAFGEKFFSLAITEPETRNNDALPTINAVLEGNAYILNCTKLFVLDAHIADYFICVARTSEDSGPWTGITIFLIDSKSEGISLTPLKTLEKDKQFEVVFDQVHVSIENVLGEKGKGGPLISDVLRDAALARAAEMIGGAQAVMDMAMSYAKERVQFGRPIGSFQAIQHHFANMWIDINSARSLLYKASWKISQGLPADKEAAMAKAHAGTACRRVSTLGHQIFAAISFTEEHDMHLYHRQSMAGDLAFGNFEFQRLKVAKEMGL